MTLTAFVLHHVKSYKLCMIKKAIKVTDTLFLQSWPPRGAPRKRYKFTGEHRCRSVISIKLQSNFIEIALRHGFLWLPLFLKAYLMKLM